MRRLSKVLEKTWKTNTQQHEKEIMAQIQPYMVDWKMTDVADSITINTNYYYSVKNDQGAENVISLVPENMIFQSVTFGLATVICYGVFVFNDAVDHAGDGQPIMTIKFETLVLLAALFLLVLIGVYNNSIYFQDTINFLFGGQNKNRRMKIKLTTDMHVQP